MKEGGDISTYLMEASMLQNHLITLGETISDNQLINVVLNRLLRSYDMVIQGVSYLPNPTYEDVMERILTQTQRMAVRKQKLGQEAALVVQAQYQSPNSHSDRGYHNNGHFRGGRRDHGFSRPLYQHPQIWVPSIFLTSPDLLKKAPC
jgi:hypothetical protein